LIKGNKIMEGLYSKYIIQKSDGTPVDPKAEYIVLRIDTDKYARMAVRYYANRLLIDNPQLSEDIRKRCDYYWMKEQGFEDDEIECDQNK